MFNICLRKNRKKITVQGEKINPESEIYFLINGEKFVVMQSDGITVDTSLNTFIRQNAELRGTKFMCLEGGCGACTCTVRGINPTTKEHSAWSVNSCLFPLFSCHGLDIVTIEGVGNKRDGYHELQKRLALYNGTQCGYCSPGMVMNMYSLVENQMGTVTMEQVENGFSGNICRCTGYRPILDAFKSAAIDATAELRDVCKDIEDLGKLTKICNLKKIYNKQLPIHLDGSKEWFKVHSVEEIFEVFNQIKDDSKYMLIHGNTAHGIYRRDPSIDVFIDISTVEALHGVDLDEYLILGANITLTDTINTLAWASEQTTNFEYCQEMKKHLELVANVSVRNSGSIAGNLTIKHQHIEFPSDIFLLLETVFATLEITDTDREKIVVTPNEFLKLNMHKKLITKIILPPLAAGEYTFRSYKILPRAQNAKAIINAGFLIKLSGTNIVEQATIVYGGINPNFIHASKTETHFNGKDLLAAETLSAALQILETEVNPDSILPDASAEYRKQLALSLFYKFILSISPKWKLKPEFISGATTLERPLSSGKQDYESNKNEWPLNQNIPKVEGLIQCSGEAEYVADIPAQPFELWGALVLAKNAGSLIVGFNTDEAFALTGVKHFYSAKDIPGDNNFMPAGMRDVIEDEEIFCSEIVKFNGQPVGIVLADTMDIANRAACLVNIQYRQIKRDVIQMNANTIKSEKAKIYTITKKEPKALGGEGIKVKGTFQRGGQYAFSLETQVCLAVPNEQGLDIHASTQWMDLMQTAVSKSLKIPKNTINMCVRRVGGAYGIKVSRCGQTVCATALGAYLSNKPVRMILTIEQTMESSGKRPPFTADYEAEVDERGKIIKLFNDFVEDFGVSINEKRIIEVGAQMFSNCYIPEVIGHHGKLILTDSPKNTWTRAPGSTEGIAMIENIMEHIAKVVKKDPLLVRLQNIANDSPIREIMTDFLKDVEYAKRETAIKAFNSNNRWKKMGISCVPMKFSLEYSGNYHASVSIYQGDGSVAISHGGIEMGQGINTKAVQVAAHILKIPVESVKCKPSNTFTAPNNSRSAVSFTSESVAYAIVQACKILLGRLKSYLEKNPVWKDAVFAAYQDNIDLAASFMHKPGDAKDYEIWGIAAAEVEVDILTGNYIFHRVDIWEDVGESMSPGIDIGQVEGAFVMGMGYWLTEQLIYDSRDGKLLTNRTWNYHPLMAKDIPVDFRIKFLKNRPNPLGVLRSKAVGEPPLCLSIVCIFAIRNALDSARKDAGLPDEYFEMELPASPEHVFLAAGNNLTNYIFK